MHTHTPLGLVSTLAVLTTLTAGDAQAGVIVVSQSVNYLVPVSVGIQVSDPTQYASNLVSLLDRDGQAGGRVLVFNPVGTLGNQTDIQDTLFAQVAAGLGYTVEAGDSLTAFDLATLGQYDALLLGGYLANGDGTSKKDDAVLATYVAGGGGVYIAGTNLGFGGSRGDMASYYNSFLDDFGIAYEPDFNNRVGILGGTGPLFANGATTGFVNGFDVLLTGTNPLASLVQQAPGQGPGVGLLAVYEAPDVQVVPEPSSLALLALGMLNLTLFSGAMRTARRAIRRVRVPGSAVCSAAAPTTARRTWCG